MADWPLRDYPIETDNPHFGPNHRKVIVGRGAFESFSPHTAVWLGGICSLFTGDGETLRRGERTFANVEEFGRWMGSWYPRLDQIHDCMAVPPRACRRAIYVVEDSIWGRRVAGWTGLPIDEISQILKTVHQTVGEKAIRGWLHAYGYNGPVEVVYTSEIEKELDLALRIWERQLGKSFRPSKRDWAKVELMSTPLWLDVLGVEQGIVAEPAHHGTAVHLPQVASTDKNNPFRFLQIGYLPFWGDKGATRHLPVDMVTHRGNWRNFTVQEGDPWAAINLVFNCHAPFGFGANDIQTRVMRDLGNIYGGV